jgi:hypothetical protein
MKLLTLQALKEMEPGVFAQGETTDNSEGCNMTGSGMGLRWVAVRGDIHDWTIYIHTADNDYEWIKRSGDKVYTENNIKKLVPCDDEAFNVYRY